MSPQFINQEDVNELAARLRAYGYEGEELTSRTAKAARLLEEKRSQVNPSPIALPEIQAPEDKPSLFEEFAVPAITPLRLAIELPKRVKRTKETLTDESLTAYQKAQNLLFPEEDSALKQIWAGKSASLAKGLLDLPADVAEFLGKDKESLEGMRKPGAFFEPGVTRGDEAQRRVVQNEMEKHGLPGAAAAMIANTAGNLVYDIALIKAGTGMLPGAATKAAGAKGALTTGAKWKLAAGKTLSHAGKIAGLNFMRTPGSVEDRAKTAALSFAYMATPALSTRAPGNAAAILTDMILNMGISVSTGQVKKATEGADTWGEKMVNLIPILGTDVGYSLFTRSIASGKPIDYWKFIAEMPKKRRAKDRELLQKSLDPIPEYESAPSGLPIGGREHIDLAKRTILTRPAAEKSLHDMKSADLREMAEKMDMPTEGISDEAVIQKVLGRFPDLAQGIAVKDGQLSTVPVINKIDPGEVTWGKEIDDKSRSVLRDMVARFEQWKLDMEAWQQITATDPDKAGPPPTRVGLDTREASEALWNIRRQALADAYGEEVSINPKINPLSPDFKDIDTPTNWDQVMPRDKYTQVMDKYVGDMKQFIRKDLIAAYGQDRRKASAQANDYLYKTEQAMRPANFLTPDGKTLDNQVDAGEVHKWFQFRSLFPLFAKLQSETNIPFLRMFQGIDERNSASFIQKAKIAKVSQAIQRMPEKRWISKGIGVGKFKVHLPAAGREYLNRVVAWKLGSNEDKQKYLSEMYGESAKEGEKSLINDLIKKMDLSPDEYGKIDEVTTEMATALQNVLRHFAKEGIVAPDRVLGKYMPRIVSFKPQVDPNQSPEGYIKSFNAHLREQNMSEGEIKEIMDVMDVYGAVRTASPETAADATPFMQKSRANAAQTIESMRIVDDPFLALDIYTNQAIRKLYFQDIIGPLNSFIKETENIYRAASDSGKGNVQTQAIKGLWEDYLGSVFGFPTRLSQEMASKDIRSSTGVAVGSINKMLNAIRDNPKLSQFFVPPKSYTLTDMFDTGISSAFGLTLGIPLNATAPIRNVLGQNPHAVILGPETYFQGLWRLMRDKDLRKKLDSLGLRPTAVLSDIEMRTLPKFAQGMLSMFTLSDRINVYTAAAGALTAAERVEAAWQASGKTLTRDQMMNLLVEGKLKGVKDVEVLRANADQPGWKFWKKRPKYLGPQFKGAANETVEMIRNGDVKKANEFFMRYMVNLTNWKYGPGGTPANMRNPLSQATLMYTSWMRNYLDWLPTVLNPKNGLLLRMGGTMASQMLLLSIMAYMLPFEKTKRAGMWVGTGPLPTEFGAQGPILDLVNKTAKLVFGGPKAMQEYITVADEDDYWEINEFKREFGL